MHSDWHILCYNQLPLNMYTLKTFNKQGHIHEKSITFIMCNLFSVYIFMGFFHQWRI